jgi:hypothetical protein
LDQTLRTSIKADPLLFQQWQILGEKVDSLKSAIQNDISVHSSAIELWAIHSLDILKELKELRLKTLSYLRGSKNIAHFKKKD